MVVDLLLAASLQAAAPACDNRTAVAADVREMARNLDAWLGRCVRIEGYVLSRLFFSDVDGFYAFGAGNNSDRPNDGWLGLYFDGWHRPAWNRLRRATAIGILHHCGRDYDRAVAQARPGHMIMSVGYCHYQGGLNLRPARVRPRGHAVFTRQMGSAARERIGDLIESGAPPSALVALADRFLAALRARDITSLRGLASLWSELNPQTPAEQQAFDSYLLGEGGSPLSALAAGPGAPQRVYFLERLRAEEAGPSRPKWHVCFCKSGDCRGRWPISSIDSTAEPGRPYVCLIAYNGEGAPGDPATRLAIERRASHLAEPAPLNGSTR